MAQDIVSDALNQIMNSKRVEKRELVIRRSSKVLVNILEMMKSKGYVDYEVEGTELRVVIKKLNMCRAVKPRYYVGVDGIDKYLRRFLPSRRFGTLIISTSKGLMDQKEAVENNVGGSVIAYFY